MVCGGVLRSGEYEPVAWKKQMFQLQLCSEDRRRWQEDRGEAVCVCKTEREKDCLLMRVTVCKQERKIVTDCVTNCVFLGLLI